MPQPQVLEGTWEEIAQYARKFTTAQRFRIIPLSSANQKTALNKPGEMIRKGMFPQLRDLTEADFKAAEWHGEEDEF